MTRRTVLLAVTLIVLTAAMIGGATMAWFTDAEEAGTVTMTAGTLSVNAKTASFYGVETLGSGIDGYAGKGRLFEVFVEEDQISFNNIFTSRYKDLNAAAFDRKNQRLYYANEAGGRSTLYFYELGGLGDQLAGSLKHGDSNHIAWGAAFGMGCYWYVDKGTDDLYRVSFDDNGVIDTVELYHEGFAGGKGFQFGDLALEIRDGIIYGSTYGNPLEYFTYNIYSREYAKVEGANATNLQLAFGADGVFYGHKTREGTWYRIDEDTGTRDSIPFYVDETVLLSDLASNYQNNWNPGDVDRVRYVFENKGTKNMMLRFVPEFSWTADAYNQHSTGQSLGHENVTVSLCGASAENYNVANWEQRGNTFYYTGSPLEPGEEVALCLKVELDGPATGNEYQGASLTIGGKVEAVQASNNAPLHVWGYPSDPQ